MSDVENLCECFSCNFLVCIYITLNGMIFTLFNYEICIFFLEIYMHTLLNFLLNSNKVS